MTPAAHEICPGCGRELIPGQTRVTRMGKTVCADDKRCFGVFLIYGAQRRKS